MEKYGKIWKHMEKYGKILVSEISHQVTKIMGESWENMENPWNQWRFIAGKSINVEFSIAMFDCQIWLQHSTTYKTEGITSKHVRMKETWRCGSRKCWNLLKIKDKSEASFADFAPIAWQGTQVSLMNWLSFLRPINQYWLVVSTPLKNVPNHQPKYIQTYQRPCKMLTRDVSNMFKHQSNCSKKSFNIQTTPSLQTTPSAWFMYPSTHAGVPVKRRMFIFGWFSRVYQYI